MQSLTVPDLTIESTVTTPHLSDASPVEPRVQRLRELFGELHNRLEFPPAVMTQQEPETVETEVIEVISPLPADPSSDDHGLFTSSEAVSEESVLSPVVEHVDPLPFFCLSTLQVAQLIDWNWLTTSLQQMNSRWPWMSMQQLISTPRRR
ncbi:MAG: hypothetical protein R3C02_04310 [Planctomycetaceae bacterium]